MSELAGTFQDATLLQCGFLEKILQVDASEVIAFSESLVSRFQTTPDKIKFIYALATGRSALSLYSFLQLIQNHIPNVFPFTLEDPIQRHYSGHSGHDNLGMAVTASGEDPSVNKYIEDMINLGADIYLITANRDGTAYRLVSDYEKGSTIVLATRSRYIDHEMRSRLSPLATEFELEVLAFLNAVFRDIQNRLKGLCDASCPEFFATIKDFEENARLVADMDIHNLNKWFVRLFHRSGRFMIGGVGRSGLIARAFEMRFSNLDRISYWERDFNIPSFQKGDVYIPISGTGNSYEPLEGILRAIGNSADVMPITANRSSRLVSIMSKYGLIDDVVFIPVKPEYSQLFSGDTSTTTWLISDYTKFRYPVFEINATIFTNSVIAVGSEFLGIGEVGMRRMHV